MLNLLNDIFDTYINLYRISLLFVLVIQWFVLSYLDRIHFRTRTKNLGKSIAEVDENSPSKNSTYWKY